MKVIAHERVRMDVQQVANTQDAKRFQEELEVSR
jgi:hypothetical protein